MNYLRIPNWDMEMNQQARAMKPGVLVKRTSIGMRGSLATNFSTKTNNTKVIAPATKLPITRLSFQSLSFPPKDKPTSRRVTEETKVKAPNPSILLIFSIILPGPAGMLIFQETTPKWIAQRGTWIKKAVLQPRPPSARAPPRGPPTAAPVAKTRFPNPCHVPLAFKETKSEVTIVDMEVKPPPPIPAIARAMHSWVKVLDKPQSRDPIKKIREANKVAGLRPKMSDNRPYKGWKAVWVKR